MGRRWEERGKGKMGEKQNKRTDSGKEETRMEYREEGGDVGRQRERRGREVQSSIFVSLFLMTTSGDDERL